MLFEAKDEEVLITLILWLINISLLYPVTLEQYFTKLYQFLPSEHFMLGSVTGKCNYSVVTNIIFSYTSITTRQLVVYYMCSVYTVY